jgi:hypothetical protein
MNLQATIKEPASKQRIGKYTIGALFETAFSIQSVQDGYIEGVS